MRSLALHLLGLLPAAPALAAPGVPPCRALLAADGRCAGSFAPFVLDVDRALATERLDDGRVAVFGLVFPPFDLEAEAPLPPPEVRFRLVDPETGEIVAVPVPGDAGPVDVDRATLLLGNGAPGTGVVWRFDARAGAWREGAPLPELHASSTTGLADDGSVLVVGGGRGAERVRVWAYDPAADRWARLPDAPTPRRYPAVIRAPGGALVCGGYGGDDADGPETEVPPPVPGCDRLVDGRWTPGPEIPEGPVDRARVAGADHLVVGGRHVLRVLEDGRLDPVATPEGTVEAYAGAGDVVARLPTESRVWTGDRWEPGDHHRVPLGDGTVLEHRDRRPPAIRTAAGRTDLDTGRFPAAASLPDGGLVAVSLDRNGGGGVRIRADGGLAPVPRIPDPPHGAAIAARPDGTLIVAGGTNGFSAPVLSTWVLAPGAEGWVPGPPLPAPVVAPVLETPPVAVAPEDGAVWLFAGAEAYRWTGGEAWEPVALPFEVHVAAPLSGRLWVLGRPGPEGQPAGFLAPDGSLRVADPAPQPHHAPTPVAMAGELWLVGGDHDGDGVGDCPEVWIVSADGRWREGPALPDEQSRGAGITLRDGRVLLIGTDRSHVWWTDGAEWVSGPPILRHRGRGTVLAELTDGRVAVAGPASDGDPRVGIEMYDPGGAVPPMPPPFAVPAEEDAARAAALAAGPSRPEAAGAE